MHKKIFLGIFLAGLAITGIIINHHRIYTSDFGVKGDGIHSDWQAMQNAINAAVAVNGDLFVDSPDSSIVIDHPLYIVPAAGQAQVHINIYCNGVTNNTFIWAGPNDSAMFKFKGLKTAHVDGIKISIPVAKTGVIGMDWDTDPVRQSTSDVIISNAFMELNGDSSVGVRFGHISGGGADISDFVMLNSRFLGPGNFHGQYAYVDEGPNTLNLKWVGGFASGLNSAYTNLSIAGTGAANVQGNNTKFFDNYSVSGNQIDYVIASPGVVTWRDIRGELGKAFLYATTAGNSPTFNMLGVELDDYRPVTSGTMANKVIYCDRPPNLTMISCVIQSGFNQTRLTSAMITLGGFTAKGALNVQGCQFQAADPFYTAAGGGIYTVSAFNNTFIDSSSLKPTAYFSNISPFSPTGATTMGIVNSSSYSTGANISGNTLTMGTADASGPGLLSNGAQSIGGIKTMNNQLRFAGTSPSVAAGTGAGTSPSITMLTGSTDNDMQLSITTGTSPTAGAVVVTVTYNQAFSTYSIPTLSAANASAAGLTGVTNVYAAGTTTTMVINAGSTALTASTTYLFNIHVFGK